MDGRSEAEVREGDLDRAEAELRADLDMGATVRGDMANPEAPLPPDEAVPSTDTQARPHGATEEPTVAEQLVEEASSRPSTTKCSSPESKLSKKRRTSGLESGSVAVIDHSLRGTIGIGRHHPSIRADDHRALQQSPQFANCGQILSRPDARARARDVRNAETLRELPDGKERRSGRLAGRSIP